MDTQKDTILELTEEMAIPMAELSTIAYIRPIPKSKGTGYALFAADGSQLATFPSYEAAFFTARQHDLDPVAVH